MPVVTNENPSQAVLMHWGLIPFWVKDEESALRIKQRALNARAETIFDKPVFRQSILSKRCLVLVDGFFEWRHVNKKSFPYYIRLADQQPFALAGIWDRWRNSNTGVDVETFSVITTEANALLAQIRISAKNLGELALPNFCPRCFWIKLKLNNKLPFQIFPGIFNSIDSYTKDIIHSYFNNNGKFPVWLEGLGELINYQKPPHYSRFNIVDAENNILLTGAPDAVFQKKDGSFMIADYKTAKFTGVQDSLMPVYEVQLNGYAFIGEKRGLNPVSDLALKYMEPVTHHEAACDTANCSDYGFLMHFHAHIKKVELKPSKITSLLAKTRQIFDLEEMPNGRDGCNDCGLLEGLVNIL